MDRLLPRDWTDFQHYKDRSPPWIRLHKSLLDNYDFQCLPVASRALAPMLWLIASDSKDPKSGAIDYAPEKIAFRLRMPVQDFVDALKPLIDNRFFIVERDGSEVLADCLRDAEPEESRGETETEADTEADALSGKPDEDAQNILAHLNAKASRDYRPVASNIRLIRARLNEGASVAEVKAVIDLKVKQWAKDTKMAQYLRPDTLFNATKFAQYVGQLKAGIPVGERSVEGFLATFGESVDDGMTIDMEGGNA